MNQTALGQKDKMVFPAVQQYLSDYSINKRCHWRSGGNEMAICKAWIQMTDAKMKSQVAGKQVCEISTAYMSNRHRLNVRKGMNGEFKDKARLLGNLKG